MYFYKVWVRSNRYHGREPLTYSYESKLSVGSIVKVPLQNIEVNGFIEGLVTKPKFKIKDISSVYDLPCLPKHSIELAKWLLSYYPTSLGLISQQFLPADFNVKKEDLTNKSIDKLQKKGLVELNKEQKLAVKEMDTVNHYLLHGITGSGKTRVYEELAIESVNKGLSAIILTPEISLTSQLADNFRTVFGNRVVVMHSQQTPFERKTAWLKCLKSIKPLVVIGPRSSLFAPLNKIGLIVIDESHETAYKQSQSPQYITSLVASYLANLTKSKLVLGTATPLILDYFYALQKDRPIIKLKTLAKVNNVAKTKIEIIDLRDKSLFSKSYILSQKLIDMISNSLNKGEQVLLYLNRRGTARIILCQNCGWQSLCPHCDTPLIYHGDSHKLLCHSCTFSTNAPSLCPVCNHSDVIYKSAGTKALADDVSKLFPKANVQRFDTDNIKSESFLSKYNDIKSGNIDILVGTQIIAKGLDLPKLGLVGVVLADTNLNLPDYTSQERTFQLINQVIGRIGRGHIDGTAVIQTYNPGNPAINFAIKNNYSSF
ncbi:MAG TPA: primosomal protein N', partial [Patescibacteria group bacterium]|nr:primosomal protein N' [Patescibacteria group bacterium]